MKIGDKIKEQRLKKEWTQEQLAELLNVSRSAVSSWEVGRNYPDLETIVAISDLFGISLDRLLREDKEMTKEVSKKIRMNKVYKIILGVLAIFAVCYLGYNQKLRMDENRYKSNLTENSWNNNLERNCYGKKPNQYELRVDGIVYWTQVLPVGMRGIPLREDKIDVIARKGNMVVGVKVDSMIYAYFSQDNDPSVNFIANAKIDPEGQLLEKNPKWSKEKTEKIESYLKKYQKDYQTLIAETIKKRQQIVD